MREFKDSIDLASGITVRVRRGADHRAAVLERGDHQGIGPWVVQQAFLWEHADLDVDRSAIFRDQRPHAFESAEPDTRIDFELRAHMRSAVQDAFLEGLFPRA